MDRRTRRYKEAVREKERSERKRQGKKPFYLMLDAEGKPYGPGRPAWIAVVNKLAAYLDPSCTHIRKQTHESMCILKERLSDDFEYSGDLNEDYLRSLLEKAVTRRRTELISRIKNNKGRPSHFDKDIWDRLEKLAKSQQRSNRSEHGKYANACRRSIGRTGSVGEHGVRQRLLEFYGRSPDPEEVLEEMHCDKGYKKTGMKSQGKAFSNEEPNDGINENGSEGTLEENKSSDNSKNERMIAEHRIQFEYNGNERTVKGSYEVNRDLRLLAAENISTNDYIRKLEEEVRSLRSEKGNGQSSRTVLLSDSLAYRPANNKRREIGDAPESSLADRSLSGKMHRRMD